MEDNIEVIGEWVVKERLKYIVWGKNIIEREKEKRRNVDIRIIRCEGNGR